MDDWRAMSKPNMYKTVATVASSSFMTSPSASPLGYSGVGLSMCGAVTFLATAITLAVMYFYSSQVNNYSYTMFLTSDQPGGQYFTTAGTWNVNIVSMVSAFLFFIGDLIELVGSTSFTTWDLQSGRNTARSLTDSFAFPLLFSNVMLTLGQFSLYGQVSSFIGFHVIHLIGYFSDTAHNLQKEKTPSGKMWFLTFNIYLTLLNFIPIIVYFAYLGGAASTDSLPWVAFGLTVAYWVISGVVQRFYIVKLSNDPSNVYGSYATYEMTTKVVRWLFAMLIIWLLFIESYSGGSFVNSSDFYSSYVVLNNTYPTVVSHNVFHNYTSCANYPWQFGNITCAIKINAITMS